MPLRWYQQEAVPAVWESLCHRPGSPVVVIPTGGGKTMIISTLARDAVEQHGGRVLVVSIRKELLSQNFESLKQELPDIDVGVYSAGLKSRDTDHAVVVCGIASVFKRAAEFGSRQLILVDEAQFCSDESDTMFGKFLSDMRAINPRVRFVGLTATPFRTGSGSICGPDKPFQHVCYSAPMRRLIDEGFLSNIRTTAADTTFDTSGLHVRAGEFVANEVAALYGNDAAKVRAACAEIVAKSVDRKSVLVFCAGVKHAEQVQQTLEELTGERVGIVTGESQTLDRSAQLNGFRNGSLRIMCNVDVLSVGFDHPGIDCVAVLRATASPGWWAQAVGRGLRRAPGKEYCLVLDFGSNATRHGPLDSPTYGIESKKKDAEGDSVIPEKACPNCGELVAAGLRQCPCGFRFPPPQLAHEATSTGGALLSDQVVESHWYVTRREVMRNRGKEGRQDTLRVTYFCQEEPRGSGNLSQKVFIEWVCLEHSGYAGTKAAQWWAEHCDGTCTDIDEACELHRHGALAPCLEIWTKPDPKEPKYTKITRRLLGTRQEDADHDSFDVAVVGAVAEEGLPF